MLCMQCGADIPPSWKKIILSNICPNCDGEIMTEESKAFLDELKDAICQMPNDHEGLAGWLMSNYQMIKVGSGKPINKFYGDKTKNTSKPHIEDDVDTTGMKKYTPETNPFMERAGIKPIANPLRDKSMTQDNSVKEAARRLLAQNIELNDIYEEPDDGEGPYEPVEGAAFVENSVFGDGPPLTREQIEELKSMQLPVPDININYAEELRQKRQQSLARLKSGPKMISTPKF